MYGNHLLSMYRLFPRCPQREPNRDLGDFHFKVTKSSNKVKKKVYLVVAVIHNHPERHVFFVCERAVGSVVSEVVGSDELTDSLIRPSLALWTSSCPTASRISCCISALTHTHTHTHTHTRTRTHTRMQTHTQLVCVCPVSVGRGVSLWLRAGQEVWLCWSLLRVSQRRSLTEPPESHL